VSATTTQLLSSGEFFTLRYDTTPVESASANVSFYTNNSKMPNFELWHSCHKWAIYLLAAGHLVIWYTPTWRWHWFWSCHARWCLKRQMSGIGDGHLMAFHMQLSSKFVSPAHHTWHLIPVPRGPRLKSRVPAGLFTRWCMLPVCTVATLFSDQCWTVYWHGCHLIKSCN
jgi:hypothetical protein